jgi:hypothetical protein
MAENFINTVVAVALRDQIMQARSAQEIRDAAIEDGIARGVFTRDASGSASVRENPVASQPMLQVQHDDGELLKRAVRLPDGSIQLLTAWSDSGLDTLQRALRAEKVL